MVSEKIVSDAVGGKTARACHNCIKKRARWYCAADDAFLCQACDSSVRSANPLARRHERVRLKTASNKALGVAPLEIPIPSWHRGVTKKARTPRGGKSSAGQQTSKPEITFPLVPEANNYEENSFDEIEDQLLYRVPIYDPFIATLCNSTTNSNEVVAALTAATTTSLTNDAHSALCNLTTNSNEVIAALTAVAATSFANDAQSACVNNGSESKTSMNDGYYGGGGDDGFLPSDMDLAEFAADVESLLGRGLENESFGIEELGLIDCTKDSNSVECSLGSVKIEDGDEVIQDGCHFAMDIDLTRESFELNFDYDSPATGEEEEEKTAIQTMTYEDEKNVTMNIKNDKMLSLDYESIICAWGNNQQSPWTTGTRPNMDECWPDFMGTRETEVYYPYGETSATGIMNSGTGGDGAREARVSRYREKRRTRLFSKKIRYEVRKLNAEKRPRMKGRFVKRCSFGLPVFPNLLATTKA